MSDLHPEIADVIAGRRQWCVITADCLSILPTIPAGSVGAVVTDPPFGTQGLGGGYGRRQLHSTNGRDGRTIANDTDLSVLSGASVDFRRVLGGGSGWLCVWCAPRTRHTATGILAASGAEPYGEYIWDKGSPGLGYTVRYSHETALICRFGDPERRGALLSVCRVTDNDTTDHPHAKPIRVLVPLVEFACAAGDVVLDPCCGIGSTGLAAIQTGRRFIGIEIDEKYAAIARRRIADAAPLFVPPVREPDPALFGGVV